MPLQQFADSVESIFGDQLISLCASQGDGGETHALLVLKDLGTAEMRKLVEPVQQAKKDLVLDLLLFTPLDLRRSVDSIPLRLKQMQKSAQVLKGQDVISNLFLDPMHLRLACEREVKNILVRLRQLYLNRAGLRPAWQDALCDTVQQVLRLLTVALELTGHNPPADLDSLLNLGQANLGLRPDTFLKIMMLRLNPERLDHEQLERLYEDYLEDVDRLAHYADKLSQV